MVSKKTSKQIKAKAKTSKKPRGVSGDNRKSGLLVPVLIILTFIVFIPSLNNDFVNWDDDVNVIENRYVHDLNAENIKKIFTTDVIGNYNPLTIFAFAIQYHFWGENAKPYHLVNLLLHLLCTVLVFILIRKLGGSYFLAFVVGLLFGVHPMRVESVAWITELKDVLFGAFYLLALISYVNYFQKKNRKFYILALLLFVFSLLSKIQAVALPLSMLVVDYYMKRPIKWNLVVEKIPFFTLSVATGLVGIYMLKQANSLSATDLYPIYQRVFVGAYSLVVYVIKSVVTYEMSALYPYPKVIPTIFYLSSLVVVLFGFLVYRSAQKHRYVVFGSLFFFFNVVFLLQVVGAGQGFLADRFTYIPYIGLFFIYGRGFENLLLSHKKLRPIAYSGGVLYLVIMMVMTWNRCDAWQNGETLWKDVLSKYDKVATPHNNLGRYYRENNQFEKALPYYNRAIQLQPEEYLAYNNRGKIYFEFKEFEKALSDYNKTIELNPDFAEGYANRGSTKAQLGDYEKAIEDLSMSIALDPEFDKAYANRSLVYYFMRDFEKSIEDCNIYLSFDPDNAGYYNHRALCYRSLGDNKTALSDFNKAIQLDPENGVFYQNRFFCLKDLGMLKEAASDARLAKRYGVEIPPQYLEDLPD